MMIMKIGIISLNNKWYRVNLEMYITLNRTKMSVVNVKVTQP